MPAKLRINASASADFSPGANGPLFLFARPDRRQHRAWCQRHDARQTLDVDADEFRQHRDCPVGRTGGRQWWSGRDHRPRARRTEGCRLTAAPADLARRALVAASSRWSSSRSAPTTPSGLRRSTSKPAYGAGFSSPSTTPAPPARRARHAARRCGRARCRSGQASALPSRAGPTAPQSVPRRDPWRRRDGLRA